MKRNIDKPKLRAEPVNKPLSPSQARTHDLGRQVLRRRSRRGVRPDGHRRQGLHRHHQADHHADRQRRGGRGRRGRVNTPR